MTPDTIRKAAEELLNAIIAADPNVEQDFKSSDYIIRSLYNKAKKLVKQISRFHSQQPQQGMAGVIDEIERRRNLIASEPLGVVRETMIANLLVDLPSAEPEVRDGWVRVEDGLPEENGKYSIWDNGYDTALFMDGKWLSENKQVPGVLSDFRAQIFPSHWKRITPPKH